MKHLLLQAEIKKRLLSIGDRMLAQLCISSLPLITEVTLSSVKC